VGQALQALRRMDAPQLEAVLRTASLGMTVGQFVDGVLTPLMREIGDEWRQGRLGIAHEHLASAIVRAVIAGLPRPATPTAAAPHLVVATPAGQRHELGAMVVAAAAAADGWRVTYLGADMPAGDIAAGVRQSGAPVLALSLTYPMDDTRLVEGFTALRQALPDIRILAGGQAAGAYRHALVGIGAFVIEDVTSLRATLEQLRLGAA
jgi:methanogenic corrinoid protein MtbC1